MINGNAIRPGNVLKHKDRLWRVTNISHTQPGKGGAYAQVEMKDIISGTKLNESFRAAESVEKVRLDQKKYQFLYQEGDMFYFMCQETYEQIELMEELIGKSAVFLQESMEVEIEFYEDKPIGVTLPAQVTCTVKETEPVVKGQTAASSYKPAIMDNGVRVMVPPFVNEDDDIVVDTAQFEYVRRA